MYAHTGIHTNIIFLLFHFVLLMRLLFQRDAVQSKSYLCTLDLPLKCLTLTPLREIPPPSALSFHHKKCRDIFE